eukprot:m.12729 g.12729  ORF g.12729 m.12729 type:complete len:383 (+) comp24254_c0_seq1:22-1170(+)
MSEFEFATATRILFGSGKASELASLLESFQSKKPFVVTGKPSRYATVLQHLPGHIVFEVHGEPSVEMAEKGLQQAKSNGCDSVISIGGGSVIDVGKIIAVLLTNGGDILDYMEVVGRGQKITKAGLPFFAVPTTAGTGAEVTKNSVLSSPEHRVKASIRSPFMLPKVAIIDPMLTLSVPPNVTASTGLDAFTQCLEPFVSKLSNPLTDAIAKEGIWHGAQSLQRAFENGQDLKAREGMCLCSLMGGLALANSKLGAVHGFAGVLGGWCTDAPHGAVCARLLPFVITANVKALTERAPDSPLLKKYDEAAKIITGEPFSKNHDAVEWIQKLCNVLNVPPLSSYGLKREDVPIVVEKAAKSSSMKGNSIVLTNEELTAILLKAL